MVADDLKPLKKSVLSTLLLLGASSLSTAAEGAPAMSKAARARANQTITRSERDLLRPEYQAVVLPSSQSKANIAARVENIFDGDVKSFYESAPGTFPNWIEIRWPQTATPDGFRAAVRGDNNQPEFIAVMIPDGVNGDWKEIKRVTQPEDMSDYISFTPVEVPALRIVFGPAESGATRVRELEITGSAPRYTLSEPDWHGEYIWYPEGDVSDVTRYFRRDFELDDPGQLQRAVMQISADDVYFLYCNGNFLGTGAISPGIYDLKPFLKKGVNHLAIKAQEFTGDEGVLFELTMVDVAGKINSIVSDSQTTVAKTVEDGWEQAFSGEFVPAVASGRAKSGVRYEYVGTSLSPLRVAEVKGARSVKPGEKIDLEFEFFADSALAEDFGFRVTLGDSGKGQTADYRVAVLDLYPEIPVSQWQPGDKYPVKGSFYIPLWAPDGLMPIRIEAISANGVLRPELPEDFNAVDIVKFATRLPRRATPVHAEVSKAGGSPKLMVNGELLCPFIMTDSAEQDSLHISGRQIRSEAPISRVFLRESDFFALGEADREEQFRKIFAVIDQRIDFVLRQDQEAYILFGLAIFPRPEWSDAMPDDNTVLPNGMRMRHSFSSEPYFELGEAGLRRIVEHLMQSPYAGHIIGIHLGIGEGPETYYWGANTNPPGTERDNVFTGDFSPASVTAFREFLRTRYNNDITELRAAWCDNKVDFATAAPDIRELRRKDFDSFRDPAKGRMAMDFWEFQADAVAKAAKRFAKVVKDASNNNWLCGLWGFYNVGMNNCTGSIAKGHHIAYNAVELALADPNIDYIAAIQCYSAVNQGTPVVTIFTLDSLRRNGKLFLEEYDIRTFLTELTFAEGHLYSEKENENIIKRDFGKTIAHDYVCWWVGFPVGSKGRMSQGWFAEDGLLKLLRYCRQVRELTYKYAFQSVAEVGLFFEDRDIVTLDIVNGSPLLVNPQYNSIWHELSAMGVPFELNSFADFSEAAIAPYRVVMLMNIYYLTAEQRQAIEGTVKKNGKTVVWLYAPGLVDRVKGVTPELVDELTGFNLAVDMNGRHEKDLKVQMTSTLPAYVAGRGHTFAPHAYTHDPRKVEMGPLFAIDDPEAVILGEYIYDGKPAIGIKKFADWTSVYCALPLIPAPLMDGIFAEAGVHRYTDAKAFLEAGNRFISLHTTETGYPGVVTLPAKSWVLDVYSRKVVAENAASFAPALGAYETGLYFLGSEAEVKKLAAELQEFVNAEQGNLFRKPQLISSRVPEAVKPQTE